MRRVRARRVDSPNGEIHFIIDESQVFASSEHFRDYDKTEIKKISRKEATKPLAIFHG